MNKKQNKHGLENQEALDLGLVKSKGYKLKSDRTPAETKKALLEEYRQSIESTENAKKKLETLVEELQQVDRYLTSTEAAFKANHAHIDKYTAEEQFGKNEEKLKDLYNLRWQQEFNMFSSSSLHFLIDSLCWKLWNWDFNSEAVKEKVEIVLKSMEDFIDKERYCTEDEDSNSQKPPQPLPQAVVSLWTEGSRMPAAVELNDGGFHQGKSPLGENGERTATWEELIKSRSFHVSNL